MLLTTYSNHSRAFGALYCFVSFTSNYSVDFSKSICLALDKNSSYNHTLPAPPGVYRVLAYDIEENGALRSGVAYPAEDKMVHNYTNTQFEGRILA